ncbi:hypothetical protein [Paenibacillus sp. NFR01]|uniref:hypothetical protein n=1 Tax=Paenibacillus sp. NFR01 TaxID=1566279 RepID=UPI0008C70D2D|nr:hypothetical protein [Paenibacillus sp. NFR01]SEU24379.1 hypothetical protein SAMN03159358_4325 [Paenibacillus sp. NFR01]
MVLKKVLIYLLLLVVAGSLFLAKYRFPLAIDKTFPAIEFRRGNPASAEKTVVHIKGKLYRPLFRNQQFNGNITVEKYDYQPYRMFDITFYSDIRGGWGNLVYFNTEKLPGGYQLGSIWKKGHFDSVKISPYEPIGPESGSGTTTDLRIIAPAEDYQTAAAIEKTFPE